MIKDLLTFRTIDKEFEEIVTDALDKQGEVFVLNRPSGRGGEKHWFLIHSWLELEALVSKAWQKEAFSVFPAALLSLRGEATPELTNQALAFLEEFGEIVIVVANPAGPEFKEGWGFDEIDDIKEFLEEYAGEQVLVGRYPDFELEIVGAYVPDEDGVIRPGSY